MANISTLKRATAQISLVFIVTLLLAATASAYTLVMRGGRRIEIPSTFVVTNRTLTYQVSAGVQVTVVLAAIDISATEKVNNQPAGSLLKLAQSEVSASSAVISTRVTRTITNRDLEASLQRRRGSEAAYEVKRKQLGLPTLEESRQRAAAVPDIRDTELEEKLISDREAEAYWRGRASTLRTEIAALDGELSYVRGRLEEFSVASFGSSFSTGVFLPFGSFGTIGNIGNFGPRLSFPGRGMARPNVFAAPRAGSQLTGRVGFGGGATRGQVVLNPGPLRGSGRFGGGGIGQFSPVGNFGQIGLLGQPYDLSYERNELITHFNELAAARAGLTARWRELEDEARRAGASPGWLRR